jgi:hypothetical protein
VDDLCPRPDNSIRGRSGRIQILCLAARVSVVDQSLQDALLLLELFIAKLVL